MKFLLFLCVVGAVNAASTPNQWLDAEWTHFKAHFNKVYETPSAEEFRKHVFMKNAHLIVKHNIRYSRGDVTYRLHMNEFGDILHHEFLKTMNGFHPSNGTRSGSAFKKSNMTELPRSVDWREKGAVTAVKHQRRCASGWTFSATGALEGQLFRKTGNLVALSEQNLIDCSESHGNEGCSGGSTNNAFRYIQDSRGIGSEEDYPYEGVQGTCRYSKDGSKGQNVGFVDLPSGNEQALTEALATVGPVSVGIDASHETFRFYYDGVYNPLDCSSKKINHGALAVGYGVNENGLEFYIVKNSWGSAWGREGYLLMARNTKNKCGIASQASYPLV